MRSWVLPSARSTAGPTGRQGPHPCRGRTRTFSECGEGADHGYPRLRPAEVTASRAGPLPSPWPGTPERSPSSQAHGASLPGAPMDQGSHEVGAGTRLGPRHRGHQKLFGQRPDPREALSPAPCLLWVGLHSPRPPSPRPQAPSNTRASCHVDGGFGAAWTEGWG